MGLEIFDSFVKTQLIEMVNELPQKPFPDYLVCH